MHKMVCHFLSGLMSEVTSFQLSCNAFNMHVPLQCKICCQRILFTYAYVL